MWFARLFILPHMVAGVFLIAMGPARLFVHTLGTPVMATIDRTEPRHSAKYGDYSQVYYHYTLDGRRFDEQTDTRNALILALPDVRAGASFTGRAAALMGHAMFLPPNSFAGDVLPLVGMALFWNGILSIFVYFLWIEPILLRRVARTGSVAAGTITGKRKRQGKGIRYELTYSFTTHDGRSIDHEYQISQDAFNRAEAGQPVTVLYDPRRPRRSFPYEYGDFVISPPPQIG